MHDKDHVCAENVFSWVFKYGECNAIGLESRSVNPGP